MVKNPIIEQSKLFFIIGIGRSGTTILQEVMNTFKGFCNLYESRVGPDRISCYSYILKNNDFSYLEKYIKNNWTDEYFVEKTPNSILCLPQLFKRYPKANYAGRFGENFGKILVQIRKMEIETKLIFCSRLMRYSPDRTCGSVCMYPAWDPLG